MKNEQLISRFIAVASVALLAVVVVLGLFATGPDEDDAADAAQVGGKRGKAGELQHQLIAAFAFGQRVKFVDDHTGKIGEYARGIFVAEQQGKAFRRG